MINLKHQLSSIKLNDPIKLEKNQSCKNTSVNTKIHSSIVSMIEKVKVAARQMMKIAILINRFFSSFIPEKA